MDQKTMKLAIVAVMMVLSTSVSAGVILQTEYVAIDDIGQMGETLYIPQNDFTYRFVNGASDISNGSDFKAVRNALGTWGNLASSNLHASEVIGTAGFTPGVYNGINDISWIGSSYGANAWVDLLGLTDQSMAVVLTWYYPDSGQIAERDMYFNDVNFDWRTDSDGMQNGGFFVEHIALHEAGHVYGLKDVYNWGQSGWEEWMGDGNDSLTMYGYSSWQNEDITLSNTDIQAAAYLFPSAIPEPKTVFLFIAGGLIFIVRKP